MYNLFEVIITTLKILSFHQGVATTGKSNNLWWLVTIVTSDNFLGVPEMMILKLDYVFAPLSLFFCFFLFVLFCFVRDRVKNFIFYIF